MKDRTEFETRLQEALKNGLNLNIITDNDKGDGNLASRYFIGNKIFICRRDAIEYLISK